MRLRLLGWIPVLVVIAAALALVPGLVPMGETLFFRDLLDFFLPMKVAFARSVQSGHLPLWDPWTHGGQPFFATLQSQVLYPPNWAFAVLPLAWGFSAFVAFHVAVGGVGMARLARSLGSGPAASALAGIIFSCGGFAASVIDLNNQHCALAWMPWACVAAVAAASSRGPAPVAGWAAALSMTLLAGEPQYALLAGLGSWLLAQGMAGASPGERAPRWRLLRRAALAAGLALAACSVQLVPLAELALLSERTADPAFVDPERNALEPRALAALVIPVDVPYLGPAGPYIRGLHVGFLALSLALMGLLARDRGRRAALLLVALGVLLALGPHVPVLGQAVAAMTPGWRYPAKYFCLATLGLSLLMARGLDQVLQRLERRRAPAWLLGALAWTVVGVAAIECITGTRSLQPLLPARALLSPTAEIERLARETAPDGPRVDGPPVVTLERLERRSGLIARGRVLDAMRERVVLLEGALPMMYGVHATWGASALPPAAQLERARIARSPADLDAGFVLLPLEPAAGEPASAELRGVPGAGPFPRRRWDGPNEAIGAPGLPPPSGYPGWREGPPGRWRFRPTGWHPLLVLSGLTWLLIAGLGRRR